MDGFENQLYRHRDAIERYVKFRVSVKSDAEDILQDIYMTAYRKFDQLKNHDMFYAWMISIARNKCNDYFRRQAKRLEIPIESMSEAVLAYGRGGYSEHTVVRDTLELLGSKDKQILYLYYWKELPQAEIARRLQIPVGTVKSRLHTARQNFREKYPCADGNYVNQNTKNAQIPSDRNHHPHHLKGACTMKQLPERMPAYKIEPSAKPPFAVISEELLGWLIIPRLGEKLSWGLYDAGSRKCTEHTDIEVVGRAQVHGIEGVEIVAMQHNAEDYYRTGSIDKMERRFVAQLTDTHCRFLAESHAINGMRHNYTFLDGESFMKNWGFGEDNCGKETHISAKGTLKREGNVITSAGNGETLDVVGRYLVTIGEKQYDTICVMDISCYNDAIATEEYLDQNGRSVLWRRFNRDDWARDHFKKNWTQIKPDSERITVNGETYVHWYDCITSYLFE